VTPADEPPFTRFHVDAPGVRAKNFPVTDPPSGSDTVAGNTGVCDSTSSVANPDGTPGAAAKTGAAPATTTAATLTATTTARPVNRNERNGGTANRRRLTATPRGDREGPEPASRQDGP